MNTCSVSFNKGIPENSTMDVKSKGNKSEDSFKDMIKNASNKPPKTSNQATKEEKDIESTNLTGAQDEDVVETKDDASISDVALLAGNSPSILDSVQLKKVVNLSAVSVSGEGQVGTGLVANEQSSSNQTAVLEEIGTNSKPNIEVVQTIPVAKGTAQMQMGEKASLATVAQGVTDGQNNENPTVMIKQAVGDSMGNQNEGVLKQDVSSGEQNKSGVIPQQGDGVDSSAITTSELKLSQPEGTTDMITIKVGEPSLNSSWKQVAEEIGNMIVEKINDEVQKVNIKLNPKDLGEIDVEFFINKGKISVALNCSNEGTKTLLATNMDSLSKVVQSSLMQDVNVNLNHDKADGQNTNSENFDGRGNNGHHQQDSQNKKKEQEQPNLDFVQRLRLGIDSIEGAEV